MEPIIANLDELSKLQDEFEAKRLAMEERKAEIMAPIMEELEALEYDFNIDTSELRFKIGATEESIRYQVIDLGKSVKGANLHAVYSKPRVTWDSKGLEGFMVAHPEIEAFRKVGQPSVSLRKISK